MLCCAHGWLARKVTLCRGRDVKAGSPAQEPVQAGQVMSVALTVTQGGCPSVPAGLCSGNMGLVLPNALVSLEKPQIWIPMGVFLISKYMHWIQRFKNKSSGPHWSMPPSVCNF